MLFVLREQTKTATKKEYGELRLGDQAFSQPELTQRVGGYAEQQLDPLIHIVHFTHRVEELRAIGRHQAIYVEYGQGVDDATHKERVELVCLAGWTHLVAGQLLIEWQQATGLEHQ